MISLTSLVKRRKLKILYAGGSYEKPREKTVCPAKLMLFRGELYFVCMSETDPKWDFYVKLCRILKAELTDDVFMPDKKRIERIEKRLVSSFGIYHGQEPEPKKIVIRFPPEKYYKQIFNERKFHHSQKLSNDKAGNNILDHAGAGGTEYCELGACVAGGGGGGAGGVEGGDEGGGEKNCKRNMGYDLLA